MNSRVTVCEYLTSYCIAQYVISKSTLNCCRNVKTQPADNSVIPYNMAPPLDRNLQKAEIHTNLRPPPKTLITDYFNSSNTKHTLIRIDAQSGNRLGTTAEANILISTLGSTASRRQGK